MREPIEGKEAAGVMELAVAGELMALRTGMTSKWLFLPNAWPNFGRAEGKLDAFD